MLGRHGGRDPPTPHHCGTVCLVGNTINHGEGGGRGIWEVGGEGESFVDQGHILLRNPSLGGASQGAGSSAQGARGCGGAEGRRGQPGGWQSVLPGRRSNLSRSACATLGMLEARQTLSKVTTDSLGIFGCLGVGVHELLWTGHFRDADHSPCLLLPALQGLISGFLVSLAHCAITKCPCPIFPSCPPDSKGEGTLASFGNERSSSVSI